LRFIDAFLIVVEILVEEEAGPCASDRATPAVVAFSNSRRCAASQTLDVEYRISSLIASREPRDLLLAVAFDATIEELPMCASRQNASAPPTFKPSVRLSKRPHVIVSLCRLAVRG
jgi:hypothetical protein